MECKAGRRKEKQDAEEVLIETSWNVKECITIVTVAYCSVLIETSWNVKKGTTAGRT